MGRKKLKKDAQSYEEQGKSKPISKKPIKSQKKKAQQEIYDQSQNNAQEPRNIVKKGRPKQEESIQVADDPAIDVQQHILLYLDSIGLTHGLVFRPEERKDMIKQNQLKKGNQQFIKWNQEHKWNQYTQKQKVKNNQQLTKAICQYVENLGETGLQTIQDTIVNIGDIAAEECTNDIYCLVAKAIESLVLSKNKDVEPVNTADKLFQQLKFLSGSFTKLNKKHYLDIEKDWKKRKDSFKQMFKNVKRVLKKVLSDMKKMEEFIKQQKWMKNELNKIKNEANNSYN